MTLEEIDALKIEKKEIEATITMLRAIRVLPQHKVDELRFLKARACEIDAMLTKHKVENKEKHGQWTNFVYEVLSEAIGSEKAGKILIEVERRAKGKPRLMVTLREHKEVEQKIYKKELYEALNMLVAARKIINEYIAENEPEINKADYLTKVSKLNKALPSVGEIEKLRPR